MWCCNFVVVVVVVVVIDVIVLMLLLCWCYVVFMLLLCHTVAWIVPISLSVYFSIKFQTDRQTDRDTTRGPIGPKNMKWDLEKISSSGHIFRKLEALGFCQRKENK